jgi:primosomal replication protein N
LEAQNRTELTGTVTAIDAVRYTPAGIPIVELKITHQSSQLEAGRNRQVAVEMMALAAGDLARRVAQSPLGAQVRLSGFLAHKGKSRVQVVLHINDFEFI